MAARASGGMLASLPTPGVLPIWENERLSVGEARAWFQSARPCLRPDWVALVDGAVPRSLIKYTARAIPAALAVAPAPVAGAPLVANTGTPAHVSARDALIAQVTEENVIRAAERDAHEAEIRYEFFTAIDIALRVHAPLLLSHLQTTYPLTYNAAWSDGPRAYNYLHLTFAGANAVALKTEDDVHDDHMVALRLKPLLDNCSPAEFSDRVNDALTNHIPFLVRPFPVGPAKGQWILNQLPDCLSSDGRRLRDTLTVAEMSDASLVARRCVDIVSSAYRPDAKVTGPLAPFLGSASTTGQRPRGLDGGKGKGRGRGSAGGTSGRGGSPAKTTTNCSVAPPRGPMCQWPHKGPCYRDPLFAGPLPIATWENSDRMARITSDRVANAERLGERVVPFIPPKTESINAAVVVVSDVSDGDSTPVRALDFDEASLRLVQSALLRFDARLACDPDAAGLVVGSTFEAVYGQDSVLLSVTSVQSFSSFGAAWLSLRSALVPAAVACVSSPEEADTLFRSYYDFPIDSSLPAHQIRVFGIRPVGRQPPPLQAVPVTNAPPPIAVDTANASLQSASQRSVPSSVALDARANIVAQAADADDLNSDVIQSPVDVAEVSSLQALAARWTCFILFIATVVFFSAVHGFAHVIREGLFLTRSTIDSGISLWSTHIGLESPPDTHVIYGALTTIFIVACAPLRLPQLLVAVVRRVYVLVHNHVFSFVLVVFVWVCVARAHGMSDSQTNSLQSVLRHERHNALVRDQFQLASTVLETWTQVVVVYELHCVDGTVGDSDIVADSGAMRSVFRDPSIFVPSSTRPCPFHVRGVGGQSVRPRFIGDALVHMRTLDGSVVVETIHDAVCLESCPHDLLSLGRLCRGGASVSLSSSSATLTLRGGSVIPMRNVSVLLIHSTPSATPVALSAAVSPVKAVATASLPPLLHALYLFSGKSGRLGSFGSHFRRLGGARCDEYDKCNGASQDLTVHSVRSRVLDDVRAQKYDCVLMSPPCNTFSVVRLKSLYDYPILRSFHHILGIPGLYALPARYSHRVIEANDVCAFACELCTICQSLDIPFILENPVQRSDPTGHWRAFHAPEFGEHGSFWQLPSSQSMLAATSATLAHVPMCFWGASRRHHTSFALSPSLENVARVLRQATCVHSSHSGGLVGASSTDSVSLLRSDGEYTSSFCACLAHLLRHPPAVSAQLCDVPSYPPAAARPSAADVLAGLPGDGRSAAATSVQRGRRQRRSNVTSAELHLTFGHASADVLRHLPRSSLDAPDFWKDVLPEPCDACLRSKATRLPSSRTHVCTHAGEIISMDLWSCRAPCIVGGEQLVFGGVDNCCNWGDLTKLKYKTQVPDAIANLLAVCASLGVRVERLHTDNENIFHSPAAREATVSKYRAQGILITTGCEYESNQNSPIERYWRTCANDARASMAVWSADEGFLPLALIDASTKRNVIPFSDNPDSCPVLAFTGRKPSVLQFRPFGCEVYMRLPHELNDSRVQLSKGVDRAVRGLSLTYGRDGTVLDRRRPGWGVLVPDYRYNKLLFSSHCTFRKGSFPGVDGVRRPPLPPPVSSEPHSVEMREDGTLLDADDVMLPDDYDPALRTPDPAADAAATDAQGADPATAVAHLPLSRRLPVRASPSPYMSHRGVGAVLLDPPPVPSFHNELQYLASPTFTSRPAYVPLSLCPTVAAGRPSCDTCPDDWPHLLDDAPLTPPVDVPHSSLPPAATSDAARLALSVLASPLAHSPAAAPTAAARDTSAPSEELACLCDARASEPVKRRVLAGCPSDDVLVSFPWGDVPYSWASGFGDSRMPYDSCVDHSIMASFDDDDSPSYNQAKKSNERQQWEDAFHAEVANLDRFGVIGRKVPADQVPVDRDIYDIVIVCKRKRGCGNTVTRHKVRFCLNGAQMNKSSSVSLGDFRTMSPTLMHRTFKVGCAAAVCKSASRTCFDVVGAYLQGKHKNGYVVFVRAPLDAREFDERGIELIWELVGPLYGEPDAGRVWYNTLSEWLIDSEGFSRSVGDPCHFFKITPNGDIQLDIYVDDGNIFDTDPSACASFLSRLRDRFEVTISPDNFYLGMDVTSVDRQVIKLSNATYIMALVNRELPDGVSGYRTYLTPADSHLLEYYEAALTVRAVPEPEFHRRYRSLVGGLCWLGPTARPDVLFATGICARAFTYPTPELYGCAVRILLYCHNTASMGITFSAHSPDACTLSAYSDSDWSVQRSTSGGCLMLAGGCVHAVSRKQECVTTSTAHAEIVAASSLSSDVEHARRLLDNINLSQLAPTVLHVDNKAVYDVSRNYTATKNLRHLDRRAFRVRDLCFASVIEIRLISTVDMIADVFTKALERKPFFKFRQVLFNVTGPSVAFMRFVAGVFVSPAARSLSR